MSKNTEEFENFDRTMRKLMSVPHSEIKAQLDTEKAEKAKRPKKRGRPLSRPLDRASNGKD
jgi:hypothetical protein